MRLRLAHPLGDPVVQAQYEAALALRAADDPPEPDEDWGRGRIFVSVAAFRDPECHKTLADLFAKAARPERIHVGLVWQIDPVEDAAYLALEPGRRAQIREMRFDWRETRGVCWARFLAQALWRGEERFLQIDSHMLFERGWDEIMIEDLAACPSPKSVIGCAPPPYLTPGDVLSDLHPGVLRSDGFAEDGSIRVSGLWFHAPIGRPVRMPYVLAGALFGPGRMIAELPYDPYACFTTEEISYAARLFTHGYDAYAAPRRSMWHQYKQDNRIRRGSADDEAFRLRQTELARLGFRRLDHLVRHVRDDDPAVVLDLDLFGLGEERTLADFEDYSGLDFRTKRITEDGLRARYGGVVVDEIATLGVPVLDDPKKRRPALMDREEAALRSALRGWEVEALAVEMVDLLIELDRHRAVQAGLPPQARLAPDRERLLADFRAWDKDALATDLARLVWSVDMMNAAGRREGDAGPATAVGR